MYFRQIHINGYDNNMCYFLGDEETREVAVVDPCDLPTLNKVIEEEKLKVVAILLTHAHNDHSGGCEEMHKRTGAPIYLHEQNAKADSLAEDVKRLMKDGDEIDVGSLKIKMISTPGHTPGSACWLSEGKLITGDTLFIEGCGRCDLEGGDPVKMYNSLFNIIGALPEETEIYPGHDYGSTPWATLAHEKQYNRFYQAKDEGDFVNIRMGY